jgi:hypothetical protein
MKTHYLCCEGDFDNLTVKHYAENSQAAIDYLETHGGGIFYNTEKQFKMWIWGCKSPMDKGIIEFGI